MSKKKPKLNRVWHVELGRPYHVGTDLLFDVVAKNFGEAVKQVEWVIRNDKEAKETHEIKKMHIVDDEWCVWVFGGKKR